MAERPFTREGSMHISVPEGGELDAALPGAEERHQLVELLHNGQRYQLVPLLGDWDETERAMDRARDARRRAARDAQPPLGTATAQLVREGRGERDQE